MGKGEGAHSETPEERFKLSETYRTHEADYAAEIERRIAALERQVTTLTPSDTIGHRAISAVRARAHDC